MEFTSEHLGIIGDLARLEQDATRKMNRKMKADPTWHQYYADYLNKLKEIKKIADVTAEKLEKDHG